MLKPSQSIRYTKILIVLALFTLIAGVTAVAETIDNETCLNCHDGLQATLNVTAHNGLHGKVSCVGCHGPADAHLDDPSANNITNPKNLSVEQTDALCSSCHQAHRELDNYGYDAHQGNDLSCFSCHNIHGGNPKLLLDRQASFCTTCHSGTKAEFMRQSQHPVKEGMMTCLSCHQFAKKANDEMAYDNGRLCRDCHPNQAGPFMYEHAVTDAYSIEGGGCMECHEPHGSSNKLLLKQPGQELCNACHFEPTHLTAHPIHSYEKMNCWECHTGVHGSFDSNLLLDPNLPSKLAENCYQSGCHSLNK